MTKTDPEGSFPTPPLTEQTPMQTKETLQLSADQALAFEEMCRCLDDPTRKELILGGLAGTGKSTLLAMFVERYPNVLVLCPTGIAAHVQRKKGVRAQTIHSAIYRCIGQEKLKDKRPQPLFELGEVSLRAGDVVAIDEASMVNARMAEDLRSLGVRILWVGDHGQLEPVGEDPGIMTNPDIRLETVHRQALNSSITTLAHEVRNGKSFPMGWCDDQVVVGHLPTWNDLIDVAISQEYDQIVVGFNKPRHTLNAIYRMKLGRTKLVEVGDRIICLMNDRPRGLFNGMQFEVLAVHSIAKLEIRMDITDGDRVWENIGAFPGCFADHSPAECPRSLQQFDYAYAITCHKAQGSEWPSVIVVNNNATFWDLNRWRYTAVTRAKDRLLVAV